MSKNSTVDAIAKYCELSKNDIVVGLGIIKVTAKDSAGYIWALPGGIKTRSKYRAEKCAGIINSLIVKGQAA